MLLVVDNFEHLLDGAPIVSDILHSAPDVRVLATSRERLNLMAECLYELEGLAIPDESRIDTSSAAVEMFTAYARRVKPDFTPDADAKRAIIRICQLVEGMPLGIQLAAAWIRSLSPQAIADELSRDFDFLESRFRDIPERHRSMRAVFEYSWNLLSDHEHDTFTHLSIFRGAFNREAAQTIAGASLAGLATLVDKSLLQHRQDNRYEVHALLRQFAEGKLDPTEAEQLANAHTEYYGEAMIVLGTGFTDPHLPNLMDNFVAEFENYRAVWLRAVDTGDAETLLRMSAPMQTYFQLKSAFAEAMEMFDRAEHALKALLQDAAVEQALAAIQVEMGWICIRLGQLTRARDLITNSLHLIEKHGFEGHEGMVFHPLAPLALVTSLLGDNIEAIRLGEELRDISADTGDTFNVLMSNYVLTGVYFRHGMLPEARIAGEKALAEARTLKGGLFLIAYCLNELANVALAEGNMDEARRYYEESYTIRQPHGELDEGAAMARHNLAEIALIQKDYALAEEYFTQNAIIYPQIGDKGGMARALLGLGRVSFAHAEYEQAHESLRRALEIAHEIHFAPLILSIIASIADVYHAQNQTDEARDLMAYVQSHSASDHKTRQHATDFLGDAEVESSWDVLGTLVDTLLKAEG